MMTRIHGPQPRRKDLMLETKHQQEYCAALLARLGFRYIVGWRDVKGYGLMAVQFPEFPGCYVNLR